MDEYVFNNSKDNIIFRFNTYIDVIEFAGASSLFIDIFRSVDLHLS